MLFTLTVGVADFPFSEEIVFAGSMAIVSVLMVRLTRELTTPDARHVLVGTALVVFVFRSVPGARRRRDLVDDRQAQIRSTVSLGIVAHRRCPDAGRHVSFRRFMAERSIAYVVGFLTVAAFVLGLPIVSMHYGLHEWTAALTGGVVDARFIALGEYGAGIAAGSNIHDSHAGLDCELRAGQSQGDVFCRDGLVHQSRLVSQSARNEIS